MTEQLIALSGAAVGDRVPLPNPKLTGRLTVEEALYRRQSIRDFSPEPLTLAEIAQLLWSAYGMSSRRGRHTAPSAGACYPLQVYLACAEGLFRYLPEGHALEKTWREDPRPALSAAAYDQLFGAPIVLVFAANYERTTRRYGDRGARYVHIDLGHAGQNVHLQAEALDLGSVAVGAFVDEAVAKAAHLPDDQKPLYLLPVGRKG